MTTTRIVRSISRRMTLGDLFSDWMLEFVLRRRRQAGAPVLSCVPEDVIGREIIARGLYERELLYALFDDVLGSRAAEFSSSTAIDVGANIGNHSCFFASRFRKVVAFEPNPTACHLLRANLRLNRAANVVVESVGLSDCDGELLFTEDVSGNLGASRFMSTVKVTGRDVSEALPVRIGDQFFTGQCSDRIALIKIDVESHELRVMRGLRTTMSEHRPVVLFECQASDGDGGAEILAFLRSVGYRFFYAVERRTNSFGPQTPLVVRGLSRIIQGSDLWLSEVTNLERRFYAVVVASPDALDS